MDAVVIAGGIPQPGEPLYPLTIGKPKALLEIGGKPLAQWVLDALGGAKLVDHVVLVGLSAETGLACSKPLAFLPNQGGMIANILVGIREVLQFNPEAKQVLVVTSDIPAITSSLVDWEVETAQEADVDLCLTLIKRQVMEARYPGSRRTYVRFKGIDVCVGDVNVLHSSAVSANMEIWNKLIASRKNPFRLAAILGLDTLLLLLLRAITLEDAVKRVTSRLNITGKVNICPYAEVGMDVDKPGQLELLRAELTKRVI